MKKAFRIFTDEPLGFALGFKPTGVETDPIELKTDDGGEHAFVLQEAGREDRLVISRKSPLTVGFGLLYPEPDALIFRTEKAFRNWQKENR